jgi:hypothetical protein
MLRRGQEQRTRKRDETSSANMVQKKNSFAFRKNKKNKTTSKRTLLSQFRQLSSRKKTITRRKEAALFVVVKSTGQVSAQTANLSKNLRS